MTGFHDIWTFGLLQYILSSFKYCTVPGIYSIPTVHKCRALGLGRRNCLKLGQIENYIWPFSSEHQQLIYIASWSPKQITSNDSKMLFFNSLKQSASIWLFLICMDSDVETFYPCTGGTPEPRVNNATTREVEWGSSCWHIIIMLACHLVGFQISLYIKK